jgi:hypothetical protein
MTNQAKETVRRIFRIFPTPKKTKPLVRRKTIEENEFNNILKLVYGTDHRSSERTG